MAKLTTVANLLGTGAIFDPKVSYPGLVALTTKINFAKAPVDANGKKILASTNYDLMEIPKGFVLLNVLLKECGFGPDGDEICAAGTVTLKTLSDSATVGSALTVGGANLAKSLMVPATVVAKDSAGTGTVTASQSKTYADGDVLCFVSSVEQASGGFEAALIGYFPDAEDSRYSPERTVPWHVGNAQRNVAGNPRY